MKKVTEYCSKCNIETTHRRKRVSFYKGSKDGYGCRVLPLKCMTCGYIHGSQYKTNKFKGGHYTAN